MQKFLVLLNLMVFMQRGQLSASQTTSRTQSQSSAQPTSGTTNKQSTTTTPLKTTGGSDLQGVYGYFITIAQFDENVIVNRQINLSQVINMTNWVIIPLPPQDNVCTVLLCIAGKWTRQGSFGTQIGQGSRDIIYYCELDLQTYTLSDDYDFRCTLPENKTIDVMQVGGSLDGKLASGYVMSKHHQFVENFNKTPEVVVLYNANISILVYHGRGL
ncbi:uncharacterized protein LOC142345717 isoform X2 [Convolutriloba macropyga]|uniref:uncharacterized protein LOC142345717 isoform X2 n=1 Tax=Convolutriloba macropyga TaxID=536237 RepID=UPI003F524E20